ncbi:IS110 family transposase [Alysiella sp.]|uniref:IS110 family transposase n=1 Tax=Alysiella sp. TaxID=1872483 RepID=UPI0026DC3E04|nr:IS110 family transposase [Alysiella sp.]
MTKKYKIYLGIDISKLWIDLVFKQNQKYQYLKISNNEVGFQQLLDFIQENQYNIKEIHACCEATNVYYLPFSNFLNAHQIAISVVNPSIIKSYAEYHLRRVKTDKQDAKLIADFCEHDKPELWQPKTEQRIQLTSLHRRTNQLTQMLVSEKQRLEVADEYSQSSIQRTIEFIETELETCRTQMQQLIEENQELKHKQKILESITGIGRTTSQILLPVLIDIDKFQNHKKLISYLGLSPIIRQSGKHKGKERVSKMGDSSIRKSLYMPARSACTRSKLWRSWFDKQIARGKHAKQVYVMMMTKLIKYAYYCIKHNEMFDESKHKINT